MNDQPEKKITEDLDPLDQRDLAKLGMLVAGIAHNMNGPLAGMMGNIDLLKMMHPELKEPLEKLAKISLRLREDIRIIVSKTVAENKRESGMVDLKQVVQDELHFYKADPRLKHFTNLTVEIDDNVPAFHAVRGDFWQSFSELVTNAVEATADKDSKKVAVKLHLDGEWIVLSIQDNGVGMNEETRQRAFEPFFTTKTAKTDARFPATLATGVGLTHVKNMMEPLGVVIELDSTEGKGTTATLRIPYKKVAELYRR